MCSDGNTRERHARPTRQLTTRGQHAALTELPPGIEPSGTSEDTARPGTQHTVTVNPVVQALHRGVGPQAAHRPGRGAHARPATAASPAAR
jgi:hypothetical protein